MNPYQVLAVEMQNNRAEYQYIHNGKASISTAFQILEKTELLIKIPRSLGTKSVCLEIYSENTDIMILEIQGEWDGIHNGLDKYIFDIPVESIGCGLYFMRPRLITPAGMLFGHRWAGSLFFDNNYKLTNLFQLTVFDNRYVESTSIRGGVIYHVFVDRFNRGGKTEPPDGAIVVPGKWAVIPEYPSYPGAPLYNNMFYGGSLWGVIEKLDFIKSLGTTAIYLSPIFRAASNHKYDTANYMEVDPIFGGEEALKALIEAANEREIKIILDGVFNHTGSDSIYFNKYARYEELGAFQSTKSKYYDWYDFKAYPTKYSCWWGIDTLPRINPDKAECGEYFVGDGGVIDKYSRMGIYGFRLDVADELTDSFIEKIKNRLSKNLGENILYGEVWEDASNKCSYGKRRRYYLGGELDGVMNYPVREGIIDFLTGKGREKLAYALTDVTNNAPSYILHNQMNLLGTHDTERIITVLGDEDVTGRTNHQLARHRMPKNIKAMAKKRLMIAYTILSTIPGIPTIFYGDEAGLEGYRDPFNRMPYPWGNEENDLVAFYQKMGRIRAANPVYKAGDFTLLHIDDSRLVFSRCDEANKYVTLVNISNDDMMISFSKEAHELMNDKKSLTYTQAPGTALIYKVSCDAEIDIE